jgi:hypothetical protein
MLEGRPQIRHPRARSARPGTGRTSPAAERCNLLRRTQRPRFELPVAGAPAARIRRERRVCDAFSAIPDLARNGTG